MNKKLATFLFVIGGTILNLILMLGFILGLVFAASGIMGSLEIGADSKLRLVIYTAAIFGGLVLAFLVYSNIMKFIQKKVDLEKYMDPIFKSKRRW